MKSKEDLIKRLRNGYESGCFDDLYPFLAEDVRRVSMWEMDDIVGKDNIIAYFKEKEELFKQNRHYFTQMATLKYINGEPAGFSRKNIVSTQGSKANKEEIPQGSLIVQWYGEGEPVIRMSESIFNDEAVLVSIDLNQNHLIKQITLSNEHLYHYEIRDDHSCLSYQHLYKKACQELAIYYFKQGYKVHLNNKNYATFPSFKIEKDEVIENLYIIVDHYPFYGKTTLNLDQFLNDLAKGFLNKQTVLLLQVKSKEAPYHLIRNDVDFTIEIIKSYELKNGALYNETITTTN